MTSTQAARRKRRSPSEDDGSQDYDSSTPDSQRHPGKQQVRHRASVACASCRERRIRCVVPDGQAECSQCKRTGTECIIKNDDERRRPISKAYMSSLSSRIALLEGMLQERGVAPPPAVHPPKTRHEAALQGKLDGDRNRRTTTDDQTVPTGLAMPVSQPPTPPASVDEDIDMRDLKREREEADHVPSYLSSRICLIEPSLLQDFEPKRDVNVRHLLHPRGRLSFDQSAGRVRYFSNTSNIHVYAESSCPAAFREQPEQARRSERVIRALGSSTHDYLMSSFWDHYNSGHQIVDQATFEADRVSQDPKFYSLFLHMAVLAAGYRFADRTREDIKKLGLGTWESTLHREAKSMLETELERPGEVPSVQALLILADLECGVGRDTQGWLYSGIANRLAFDIGLHVACGSDMSDTESRIRRQVMRGCVMLDRQLAVFLGRPTSIKHQDIGFDIGSTDFSPLSINSSLFPMSDFDAKPTMLTDAAVYQQLLELLGIVSNITGHYSSRPDGSHVGGSDGNGYLQAVALDRELQNWYRRLPAYLSWSPMNVKTAPLSFFVLHQQFHVCMVLLHRPWANYGPPSSESTNSGYMFSPASRHGNLDPFGDAPAAIANAFGTQSHANDGSKVALARSMCTQHAIRVARIFWQQRQRFDGKKMGLMAVQHAGTAALALMGALAHRSSELDHQSNLRYLQVLSSAIYDMSQTYHPAARMYHLLKSMLVDIRKEMVSARASEADSMLQQLQANITGVSFAPQLWGSGIPNMYPSHPVAQEAVIEQAAKKRRLSERRPSEAETPKHPFLTSHFAYPSPSTSTPSQRSVNVDRVADTTTPEVAVLEDSETFDFNFDFLNESIVDFEGMQGNTTSAELQDAAASPSATVPSLKVEPEVEAVQQLHDVDIEAQALSEPQAQPQPQHQEDDDDDLVEMTIEQWLSEPKGARAATPRPLSPASDPTSVMSQLIDSSNTMGWMEHAGKMGAVEASLHELMEGGGEDHEEQAARNRELDFLSF